MIDERFREFVPNVRFELIPICDLYANLECNGFARLHMMTTAWAFLVEWHKRKTPAGSLRQGEV